MAGFDKVVTSYAEAMAGLEDNMTVIAGGFGLCGIPEGLIGQIKKMATKGLTVVWLWFRTAIRRQANQKNDFILCR